jgi:hypothetical protein
MSKFIPPKNNIAYIIRKPRLNIWVCEHGCETVAVDVAIGVAPFFIRCKNHPKIIRHTTDSDGQCTGRAQSTMYPKDYAFNYVENIHWEMDLPSEQDIKEMISHNPETEKQIREYCNGTNLVMKPRSKKAMIFYGSDKK